MSQSSTFLRRALIIDAVISGASGLLMLAGAAPLSRILGVSTELLTSAGLSLLPFTAFLIWLCTRAALPRTTVWLVIALNIGWVIGSIALLFVDGLNPSGFGIAFILVQAIAVAAFAEIQYVGLRRWT